MSISNARIVSQTASDVTVAVDTDQQYDFVTAAMRTDQAWVEGDKTDIEDGDTLPGLQTQTQSTLATNTFTFTGVTAPYHIGFSAHSTDVVIDPPPVGSVPQPTALSVTGQTANSISLAWLAPENPNPTGLYYDYSADWEGMANNSVVPNSLFAISEGSAGVIKDSADPTCPRIVTGRSRYRGDNNALLAHVSRTSDTNFINRQEVQIKTASYNDKYRPTIKRRTAFAYSIWHEWNGVGNFYQVHGQMHDAVQQNLAWHPPGTPQYAVAPILAFSTHANTGNWRLSGSVNTREYNTSNTDGKNAAYNYYWPRDVSTYGRWVDVVCIYIWDAIGSATFPADGAPPYTGECTWWIDGVKQIEYGGPGTNTPFGPNDPQSPGPYHRVGIYAGFRPGISAPAGGWVNTTQKAWFSSLRVAEGDAATYENVSMAGRVTSIEILRETAPGQTQVVASLPPSFNDYTLTGLTSGQYKLSVRCRYDNETGTPSGQVTVNI